VIPSMMLLQHRMVALRKLHIGILCCMCMSSFTFHCNITCPGMLSARSGRWDERAPSSRGARPAPQGGRPCLPAERSASVVLQTRMPDWTPVFCLTRPVKDRTQAASSQPVSKTAGKRLISCQGSRCDLRHATSAQGNEASLSCHDPGWPWTNTGSSTSGARPSATAAVTAERGIHGASELQHGGVIQSRMRSSGVCGGALDIAADVWNGAA